MKKDSLREDLNRLLSQKPDPTKVDSVMDRLLGEQEPPIDRRSIPDRLWVLWTRIKELRTEAEDLSIFLNEHSGSRLPQVIDLLNQAEVLTNETISQTTKTETI